MANIKFKTKPLKTKDHRANIKMSQESKKRFQKLKKGETYNQTIERLYCKDNPKDKKCNRGKNES